MFRQGNFRWLLTNLGFTVSLVSWLVANAAAQQTQPSSTNSGIRFHEPATQQWKFGVVVTAATGPAQAVVVSTPVPAQWPEQQVKIIGEDISPQVRSVRYRQLDGVRQMVITIPRLKAGETATALITFEVTRHFILEPEDPTIFVRPAPVPREVRAYLAPSPFIESQHPKIRALAKEVIADEEQAWTQVERMFDWVRARIEYKEGELKGALAALEDGQGDCEEMTSLFVALCRANNIPARTIWVPGHCYPEFYLQDDRGRGHWIPCQAAGAARDFGSMPEHRPVLQKGDSFRVPEDPKQPRPYAQVVSSQPGRGFFHPQVQVIQEQMPSPPAKRSEQAK